MKRRVVVAVVVVQDVVVADTAPQDPVAMEWTSLVAVDAAAARLPRGRGVAVVAGI